MAIIKRSQYSFAETASRLAASIAHAGNTIFATVDQTAAATSAGLALRPTTLIVFGNPKAGTLLMQAFPLLALELPLKILVWEEDGAVNVAYTPLSELAARYDVTGQDGMIANIDRALATLTDSVAAARI